MNPQLGFSIGSTVCPGLSKLIEECGEVLQVAGKLIATGGAPGHWDGTNLKERMEDELGDLMAAMTFYADKNGLEWNAIEDQYVTKFRQFNEWHENQLAAATTPEKMQ
jgi:NTP pyrophosphatase (non-canonical NTP hydrolase)